MENIYCPHCGKGFQLLKVSATEAEYRKPGSTYTEKIKVAVYSCPLCLKAISIQEDPLASKKAIVMAITKEITSLLRGH